MAKPFVVDKQSSPACGAMTGIPRWKRLLDIAGILLALPVVLPLGLVLAVVIKSLSRGPVFFRQERVGYRGRWFQILKFRTMVTNADPRIHQAYLKELIRTDRAMVKLDAKRDPRLIPFGSWLRSSGLDELPQLVNVMRGEMSLVGPRPAIPYEVEQYVPRHLGRLETLPGLTGLWQVSGKNRTTFEEMMELDLHYVRHKSLLMDLKIIFKTIPAITRQVYEIKVGTSRVSRAQRGAGASRQHGEKRGAASCR
ncbi:MAG: sugar transferase [Verrucomicrobia bacterium]|nr:sugar transferase [Verrucomicrobiota bacterium]